MEQEKPKFPEKNPSFFDELLLFLKSPDSKKVVSTIKLFIRIFHPHPAWRIGGDLVISVFCMGSIIYCANEKYIESTNVASLITLVIGAIIGSRFKNS